MLPTVTNFTLFLNNKSRLISNIYFRTFTLICSKISAHEFERGGLVKPIVNTIDGTPTFLSVSGGSSGGCSSGSTISGGGTGTSTSGHGDSSASTAGYSASTAPGLAGSGSTGPNGGTAQGGGGSRAQRMSRNELRHLDEKQLIFELVKDICNELDVRSLCHKILQNVSILLKADRGSLFLVEGRIGGATASATASDGRPEDDGAPDAADNVPKK